MVIKSEYGITLSRLRQEDIELVRKWRNDPEISQFMEYRNYITVEMQKKWFQSLNYNTDYFFISIYQSKKIGLVDVKRINWERRIGETGIFIYDSAFQNTFIPVAVYFSILDFSFYVLGLDKISAHILRSNKRAIKFNSALGFKLQENQEDSENQLYLLGKDVYEKKTGRLRNVLIRGINKEREHEE